MISPDVKINVQDSIAKARNYVFNAKPGFKHKFHWQYVITFMDWVDERDEDKIISWEEKM